MPLYEYHCKKCDKEFTDFNTVDNRENCKCPDCGRKAKMLISAVRLDYYNMGVSDHFPTALQKWEKMHKKEAQRKSD